ncbi:MAG: WYL domain-containing protein [Actinomycetota bacterium]|nr:WYL domain-containing protein [Actinomycetota bacterium]
MTDSARARATSGLRVQRLLALVSWVAANDGPAVAEVCRRFQIAEDQLVEDLSTAMMVGADSAEYTDMPIEVVLEDGRAWVHLLSFRRPLRLTPAEGLALVAAGAALLDVPGADPTGPLGRALAKLAAVLGIEPGQALDVDLGAVTGDVFGVLRKSSGEHHQVEMQSYTESRDTWTTRTIDPWRVFTELGRWYVHGYCHTAGGERVFRIDRIRTATMLSSTFRPPRQQAGDVLAFEGEELPRATLRLAPAARWVLEAYPVQEVESADDGPTDTDGQRSITVSMEITGKPWLERLLLRLGPNAEIVGLDERLGGPDIAARAARNVLASYRDDS